MRADLRRITLTAAEAAFLPEAERRALIGLVERAYGGVDQSVPGIV
jgi:adenosine deaminase